MRSRLFRQIISLVLVSVWFVPGSAALYASDKAAEEQLRSNAQIYMEAVLHAEQPDVYFTDMPLDRHDRFYDNSPAAREHFRSIEDKVLESLRGIDTASLPTGSSRAFYATFLEKLEGNVVTRVCRSELWNVSHMGGAHTVLDLLVEYQPLENEQDRKDALARWSHAAKYFRQEIGNLQSGLEQGYTAPKTVVVRVIQQLQGISSPAAGQHPFMALASRANNEAFTAKFRALLDKQLLPAIKAYQTYLEQDYLPRARTELGIHALPAGRQCYIALYRHQTTLNRTPEQVYELGLRTVEKNRADVVQLGEEIYATTDFKEAVAAANGDSSQKFNSPEAMRDFYLGVVKRAKQAMPRYFYALPAIELEVEPIPTHQQGSGRSAHYVAGSADRPGIFAYDPADYSTENFGSAEIVTVHEGYPGHHMQIALVQEQPMFHPLQGSFWNSAFGEGWARYAENLAEEAGIYQSKSARILRRAWPARGMVADPAMHLLGWSNEKVAAFLVESGMPDIALDPNALLDRMAIMPAQLTTYDSGALELFALRQQMQEARGEQFDVREFHQLVLEHGMVPLSLLRKQVEDAL